MTLIVCCYTPNGIALSADSRTTGVQAQQVPNPAGPKAPAIQVQVPWVISDSTRKLFTIRDRVAVATWGDAFVGGLPISHHMNDFAQGPDADGIETTQGFADALLKKMKALGPTTHLGFLVAGYDGLIPFAIEVNVNSGSTKRWNVAPNSGSATYGAFWGGDWDIVGRLVGGNAPVPYNAMNLQDAVDFSRHLIRTTVDQMRFEARVATVGGAIDTVTATSSRIRFVVRKELHP